jgi:hypothetical protein
MGEWGAEDQLIDFGREGEKMLSADVIARPKPKGAWLDVIESTKSS